MRADRLITILLLLQTRGRLTARQLAEELEVSERTVLRDMEALCASGVPLTSQRGNNGGWTLIDGYRTDLTGLKDSEIQALFVGTPDRLLADLKLDRASHGGLLKLLNALPATHRRGAEYARQRIHIDLAGWSNSRDPVPLLPLLQDAVFRERKARIAYDRAGDAVERLVDPLGLVAKGSTWYLVAAVDGAPRTYRVSRITAVDITATPAERPADFDLGAFWHESMRTFRERLPRYDGVIALVDREALPRVQAFLRYGAIDAVEEHDAARVRATLHFDTIDAAAASLACEGVEVLEPRELRDRIARNARAILAAYATS
jgi:predicted DNA-binding transcriptional regulator YafY